MSQAADRPTGAGFGQPKLSHQPNVPGLGIIAGYGSRFWSLAALIGVAAGLIAALLSVVLHLVEGVAWAYHSGSVLAAVRHAGDLRRVFMLLAAGLLAGAGAILISRLRAPGAREISDGLWLRDGRLALWSSEARALLSIVIVGMGASLGREGAPQLASAAVASRLSQRAKLPAEQRRLLVAAGAGAGMAAIYNVPLGGALFAVEVLLGTMTLPVVAPAVAICAIATAVGWIAVPDHAVYQVPTFGVSGSEIVWAACIGPLAGLVAVAWARAIERVDRLRPVARGRLLAPAVVFAGLGVAAIVYPELLGNGQDLVQLMITGHPAVVLIAVMLVLKPFATAACLGTGAPGGLFTPTLTLGVLFGALLGHGWAELWPGGSVGADALIGGGAVLAAAMQGPLTAILLVLELTGHADGLTVPLVLASAEATVVARLLRAPSIYSARLKPGGAGSAPDRPAG